MKLQVNKEHEKCSYKSKGRKIFVKLGSIFCGVSLFSGIIASAIQYKLSEETLIPITSDARNSIYLEDDNVYFKNIEDNTDNINDYNITNKTAVNVNSLEIDMLKNNDLSYISNFSNLKKIKILNAQMLSDNDILIINNSSLENIEFIIDIDDVIKNNKKMPNFHLLSSKTAIINSSKELIGEVEQFKFYNLVFKYYPQIKNEFLDYNKYYQIDNKLNEIMSKLDLYKYSSIEERVVKIAFCIVNFLNYDTDIGGDLNNFYLNDEKISQNATNKSKYYSRYLLSSSLIEDTDYYSNGICVNYAALFEAICAKLGIEAHSVGGITYENIDIQHQWNYVKVDDEYILIDVNAIYNFCHDKYSEYSNYFSKYMKDQADGIEDKEIMNKFIEQIFVYYSDYMEKNYFSYDNDAKILSPFDDTRNVEYYNNSSNNEIHDIDYILSTLIGSISGIGVVIPSALILSKKRKLK